MHRLSGNCPPPGSACQGVKSSCTEAPTVLIHPVVFTSGLLGKLGTSVLQTLSLTHSLKGGERGSVLRSTSMESQRLHFRPAVLLAGTKPRLVQSGNCYGKRPDWEHTLDILEFPGSNAQHILIFMAHWPVAQTGLRVADCGDGQESILQTQRKHQMLVIGGNQRQAFGPSRREEKAGRQSWQDRK